MKKILLIYLLCFAGFAQGQQAYVQNLKSSDQDVFQRNLYSADRVMDMRNELALTEAQASKIKKIHSENAGKFSTMKWDLDDATAKLKDLLDESKIDEVTVQKQMDKVLALENSLKKQQLSTMVSIKNELSFEQQEILQKQSLFATNNGTLTQILNGKVVGMGTVPKFSESNDKVWYPNSKAATSVNATAKPLMSLKIAGFGQENAPIYMLEDKDGMKQVKDLKDINPEDIKSIEVLKDKSAIDVFGEKGENGVIIIKLKKDPKN
ncbi:TonB-dependent receptor plug domain-containing protein [Algoriphagus sp. D3-2-R+10]|uniref:Spy/CpxP family protein refolding chaperone n=1 Tax=Algoriphagus aurantiacus TaxID=3103948 RepID=UPI002B3741F1|nr:hypothetical protein [Algoriphagus sp. D3-2-R+10]MEB2774848.1 TonB-dependent receptor plug domain-containing protein [Algoriphagus sp. D3-2-R+10]